MAPGRSYAPSPAVAALAAGTAPALAAVLPLLYDVIRTIPESLGCGERSVGDAVLSAYRAGSIPLHLAVIAVAAAGIAVLSAGRGRGPLGIGRPTVAAAGIGVAVTLLAAVPSGGQLLGFVPFALVSLLLVLVAGIPGPVATGAVAAALLLLLAGWSARRAAAGDRLRPRLLLWVVIVLSAGHAVLVQIQGEGPFFC